MRSTFKQFLAEDSSLSGAKLGLRFDLQLKALDVNNEGAQSFRGAAGLAASSLGKVLNEEVLVKSLASASPSKTRWTIQPSENPSKNGFFSAVISTPVLYTSALTQAVKKLSSWLEAQDAETTDSDSLTAVIDVKGLSEKLDPVKLVLFLDLFDPSLVFSGELKKFSPPDVEVAIQQVKHNGKLSGFKNLQKAALSALGQRRDGYTNFSKLQDGLIEFRLGGGSGYEHSLQGFIKKALKLARAVELAGDPASEKAEYVQRLRALLTGSEGALQVSKDQKNVPVEILRLYKFQPDILPAWKRYSIDKETGHARTQLLVLIKTALAAAKSQNTSLDASELKFFKQLLKSSTMQSSDVDSFFGGDHLARLKFKKDLGL